MSELADWGRLAAEAPSGKAFREATLDALGEQFAFDAALFHALSPRVPVSTAALRGLEVEEIVASMKHWDEWAVELGRFRDFGVKHGGVATDRDALPMRGRSRTVFERAFATSSRKRAKAAVVVHLIVRERIISAIILVRWQDSPFTLANQEYLRAIAPFVSVADALHQSLDQAAKATIPSVLRCHDQRLTPRQREIVEHVALGHTNEEIAKSMSRSANTIRNLLAEVMRRLGAANRADVVRMAVLR